MADKKHCIVHLEGGVMTRGEAERVMSEIKAASPEDLSNLSEEVRQKIMDQIEDSIDGKVKQVSDMVLAHKMADELLEGSKTVMDVARRRLDRLVGRNSLDTQRRVKRNALSNNMSEMQRMFRTQENPKYRRLSDVAEGTDEERALYTKIRDFQEELTPDKLTPEKINSLLKGADELDRLAYSVAAHNAYMRQFAHRHGIAVRFDKNYVIQRRYDAERLRKLKPEGFIDLMIGENGLLDVQQTFGNLDRESMEGMLRGIYNDILRDESSHMLSWTKGGGASKGALHARKFVFKDANAEYDAFNQLSIGSLAEQIDGNDYGLATSGVKIQNFGYDHQKVLAYMEDRITKKFGPDAYELGKLDKTRVSWLNARSKQAESDFTGDNNFVATSLTDTTTAIKTAMALTKLGNAVTTAMLDVVDTGRQVFYVNGSMFGGFKDYTQNFWKVTAGMSHEQRAELADQLGVVLTNLSSGESMRLARGDLSTSDSPVGKILGKFGDKAFNIATLLPAQTSRSKLSSALVGAKNFASLMDKVKKGDTLNKFEADTLKEYGFSRHEISVLANNVERTKTFSSDILTGKNIRDSLLSKNPEEVASMLGVSPEDAGEAVLKLAEKYQGFINDFFTRGTPTPELATKTLLFKGTGNEMATAAMGVLTQFMDTPMAQLGNLRELAVKLQRINNVEDAELAQIVRAIGPDFFRHSLTYVPVGMSSYIAYDLAFSAVMQKESFIDKWSKGSEEERKGLFLDALGRTSYVPFVAELIENQTSKYYNVNAMDTFNSPGIGMLRDVLSTMPGGDMDMSDFLKRHSPNAAPLQLIKNVGQRAGMDLRPFDEDQQLFGSGL